MTDTEIVVRRATDSDLDAIVDVAAASLGWAPGEPHAELFRWKHLDNPFGASPMWVAEAEGRLAGFRAFMRWELSNPDRTLRAVRAVDTATHPDFQRRGVFSALTMAAVEEMANEGVDIVFNTPNTQSRPGYLKMGWIDVGRLPIAFRPTSVAGLVRTVRARTAAEKWSEQSAVGLPALDVLEDPDLARLLDAVSSNSTSQHGGSSGSPQLGLSTRVTVDLLRWRYRFLPLHYRAWAPDGAAAGIVLFRVRRRGAASECSVAAVLAPDHARRRSLLAGLGASVDADYLLMMGRADVRGRFIPMPSQGPRLTARFVTEQPDPDIGNWHLTLGDVELF